MQAVKRFMKLECKCHGVSGSCSLRTCWRATSDFRRTGDYLRRKYDAAVEVTMNQDGTGFTVQADGPGSRHHRHSHNNNNKGSAAAAKNELVYVENSPDYCHLDRTAGGCLNKMADH